jgi:pilus assembly protein FimV
LRVLPTGADPILFQTFGRSSDARAYTMTNATRRLSTTTVLMISLAFGCGGATPAGSSGAAGTSGGAGTSGAAGSTGAAGTSGAAGSTGSAGTSGAAGSTGSAGSADAAAGTDGATGDAADATSTGDVASDAQACTIDAGASPTLVASETYGEYVLESVTLAGAPCGAYTLTVQAPKADDVELRRAGSNAVLAHASYDWLMTVSATDATKFATFHFAGYFDLVVRKAGSGTENLYDLNLEIFDGTKLLVVP